MQRFGEFPLLPLLYCKSKQGSYWNWTDSNHIFEDQKKESKSQLKERITREYPNRPVFQGWACLPLPPILEMLTKSSSEKTASLKAKSEGPCHWARESDKRDWEGWTRRSRQSRTVVAPASSAF